MVEYHAAARRKSFFIHRRRQMQEYISKVSFLCIVDFKGICPILPIWTTLGVYNLLIVLALTSFPVIPNMPGSITRTQLFRLTGSLQRHKFKLLSSDLLGNEQPHSTYPAPAIRSTSAYNIILIPLYIGVSLIFESGQQIFSRKLFPQLLLTATATCSH